MPAAGTAVSGDRALSFRVAGRAYSIPAGEVLEIVRRPAITRVPHGPASLAGLMNFHGAAIAVVRLAELLGLEAPAPGAGARIIVRGDTPPVGLLVDDVLALADNSETGAATGLDLGALLSEGFAAAPVERARVLADADRQAPPAPPAATIALLTFRVAGQRYALPLASVREVMVLGEDVAALPRGAVSGIGMLERRESVLPLVSLAALLGLSEAAGRRHVLVTEFGGSLVGLVAGAVDGVNRVPEAAIEPVPAILQRGEGDAEIDAIARLGEEGALVSILSPARLFGNREVGRAIAEANGENPDMQAQPAVETSLQFVVFSLGGEAYGLPIGSVDEIVHLPETITRVPNAPEFVLGVINLRGEALPVIDLRRRFESARTEGTDRPRVIVVTIGALRAGFVVDGVSEILRVPEAEISPAPSLPGEGARLFDRIARADGEGGMILMVDPAELLDRAERDLLARFRPDQGLAGPP